MKLSESEFIRDRSLKLIRESSMNVDAWDMTLLNRCHNAISSILPLKDGEYSLISFYAASGDWTLYTTRRIVGEVNGVRFECESSEYGAVDFGNFKLSLDSPQVAIAKIRTENGDVQFRYETGYASMAPINYFKFWNLKWPVWKETYRLENTSSLAECFESFPWETVNHAYGPATDAPRELCRLLSEDEDERMDAICEFLCSSATHQYTLYPATPYVMRCVLKILEWRDVCELESGMNSPMAAHLLDFMLTCARGGQARIHGSVLSGSPTVEEVAQEGREIYKSYLNHKHADVRKYASELSSVAARF